MNNNSTNPPNYSDFGKKTMTRRSLFDLGEIVSRYIRDKDQLLQALEVYFDKMSSDHEKQIQYLQIQNQVLKDLIIELKIRQDSTISSVSKPSVDEEELAVLELSKLNQSSQQSRNMASQIVYDQQIMASNRPRRTRKNHNSNTSKQTTDTDTDDDFSEEQCLFEPKDPSAEPYHDSSSSKQTYPMEDVDGEKTDEATDNEMDEGCSVKLLNLPSTNHNTLTRPLQDNNSIMRDPKPVSTINKPVTSEFTFINHDETPPKSKRGRKRKLKPEESLSKEMISMTSENTSTANSSAGSGVMFFQSDYIPVVTSSSANQTPATIQKIPKKRGPKPGSKRGAKTSFTVYSNDSFKTVYDANLSMNGKQPNNSFFSDSKSLTKTTTSVPDSNSTSNSSPQSSTSHKTSGLTVTNISTTALMALSGSSEGSSTPLSTSKPYSVTSRFVSKCISPQRYSLSPTEEAATAMVVQQPPSVENQAFTAQRIRLASSASELLSSPRMNVQ
ncbi:hypothetical protein C9374_008899 [Naegleria lovaniensis]|uniref:Polycomb group protein RNA binding region domain-containing protein n=1 Tax=Naegleria lovaniensis TaxID=51637 RepID=A0AA88GED2_NAELO|nr:uncharacterized protein C9374_008899 [Naegleria lovaniensis]KAG2377814.1 hypothetical protein C9374_008899 [Naegleria lovaniensis]